MKRTILAFAVAFAVSFSVGLGPSGGQAEVSSPWCYAVCEEVCGGPAFCTDWGCVCV